MKIAVCDDDKTQTEYIAGLVAAWADRNRHLVVINTFDNAQAFQFAWSGTGSYDAVLLDIQMPGQNGMELAREIRKVDETIAIIFITGFTDYIGEGYDVAALHYLLKPVGADKLCECLDKVWGRLKNEVKTFLAECGGEKIRIRQDEILMLEAFAHSVAVTAVSQCYEVKESLGEIRRRLDEVLFVQPHRSYVVGLKYIRKIGKTDLTLDNGTRVPLSRRMAREVNRSFIRFYHGGED